MISLRNSVAYAVSASMLAVMYVLRPANTEAELVWMSVAREVMAVAVNCLMRDQTSGGAVLPDIFRGAMGFGDSTPWNICLCE